MLSGILRAQNTSGTTTGRVTDATGASISGARVSIMNAGSGDRRNLTTDSSGKLHCRAVIAGILRRNLREGGVQNSSPNRNHAASRSDRASGCGSEIGSTNERIEVTANALTLDTDSSAIGTVVDQRQVSEFLHLPSFESTSIPPVGKNSASYLRMGRISSSRMRISMICRDFCQEIVREGTIVFISLNASATQANPGIRISDFCDDKPFGLQVVIKT